MVQTSLHLILLDDTSVHGIFEGGENSGIFYNTDDDDDANLDVSDNAKRGYTAVFDYNDVSTILSLCKMISVQLIWKRPQLDAWNSGEALTVTLIDQDLNKNTGSDEDIVIKNTTNTHLVPSLQIGSPLMLTANSTANQVLQLTQFQLTVTLLMSMLQ